MKILRLSLKNLNSFNRAIDLDFTSSPLSDTSLLAITGPTGSGKTTLLDAISVSLYNKTPRLSGNDQNNPTHLLRQGEKEGYAEVTFEARGGQYLARWEATRDRKGEVKPCVKLLDAGSGKLITSRGTKKKGAREMEDCSVEDAVGKIIGLDFAAFNRSVMLAQGEFAAFLKAEPEKKRNILQHIAGLDIYERLKKTLTEKVRSLQSDCESREKAFAQFSPVTADELEEEEKRCRTAAVEISRLQAEKAVITVKKEEEMKRDDSYRRLSARKEELTSLLGRKDIMDELGKTLKTAQRAANVRKEGDAFKTEEEITNKVAGSVIDADEKLTAATIEVERSRLKSETAEKELNAFLEARESKVQAIEMARIEETQAEERRRQAGETEKKLQRIKTEMEDRQKESQWLGSEKQQLGAQIDGDERFLKEHEVPQDADSRRENAASILADLKSTQRNLDDTDTQFKRKNRIEKELRNRLKELDAQRGKKETAVTAALKKLEESMNMKESLLRDGDTEQWEKEKAQALALQVHAAEYEQSKVKTQELEKSREELLKNLISLEDHTSALLSRREEMKHAIASAEKRESDCEREKERALIAGNVAILRKEHLQDSKPCPVCGSCDHPWKDRTIQEGDEVVRKAREAQEKARRLVEKQRQELMDLEQTITINETEKVHNTDANSRLDIDLNSYKARIEECETIWRSHYPDSALSSQYLRETIDNNEKKLKDYHQALLLERESQNACEMAQAALQICRSEINSVNEQLSTVTEEMEELNRKSEQTITQLKKGEVEFTRTVPSQFHGREWEQSLRDFAGALEENSKRRERLSRVKPEHERIGAELESLMRLVKEKELDASVLYQETKKLHDEEKALRQSVLKKTDDLGSDGARQRLEKEQKEREEERNRALKSLQELEQARIRLHTEVEQKRLQHEECCKRREKALSVYLHALEREGFKSPEEHVAAFRDEQWLGRSDTALREYHESVHGTESQIEELEKIFADRAFDIDELSRLRKEAEELENSLNEKLRGEGELKGHIGRMKDDLQKRKETEELLEILRLERDRWMRLQSCILGNTLRDFALDSVFNHLVYLARQQMLDITHRYELKAGDGFRISVLDRWNGCLERPVETLSGGETFLVSLSLALALSELSRGHAELDSLFLDEGFGTLDNDTLEVVLATLEKLHLSGKKITIISHIQELTRRIPVRIAVKRLSEGSSTVSLEGE